MKERAPGASCTSTSTRSSSRSSAASTRRCAAGRWSSAGGAGPSGLVAAASTEARARGVRAGLSLAEAQRLCPEAVVRPGDLEAYARVSDEVTAILLSASRRVERPSADEAYVDLTPEHPGAPSPVPAAEVIKDELQRRLGLDASLGLASSRLAARVASSFARPRGFVVVLPGYESSFLRRQARLLPRRPAPPPRVRPRAAGISTLGELAAADPKVLDAAVGPSRRPGSRPRPAAKQEEPVGAGRPAGLDPGAGHRARPALATAPALAGRGRRPGGAGPAVASGPSAWARRRSRSRSARREGVSRQSDAFAAPMADEDRLAAVARAARRRACSSPPRACAA